ncbi:proline iminopeptidase [Actinopolymorpha singaporensis]|uniref:Proline iminopeptidase n=1 Tax=Actinopolymorpha singaporensis TaxID=117157 RepID=A0A1H1RHE4_9ACTN|nr:proline iminopeptidase [Actinopolymorpha singaporensis]
MLANPRLTALARNPFDGTTQVRDPVPVGRIREEAVTVDDGARLWTMTSGPSHAAPVVLCHGGPGLWDNLGPVAAMLDSTRLVHRYDHRGCGRSTGPDDYRLERAVADLDALRRHWGHERWTVFGHSWGATLALVYAWTHPDRVHTLVYCDGVGPGSEWREPNRAEVARRLTPEQIHRRDALERQERSWEEEVEFRTLYWLPDHADRSRAEEWARAEALAPYDINWRANASLARAAPDVVTNAAKVTAPTLLVHGEHDPRPIANVARLVGLMPNATLAPIANAGHSPWLEAPGDLAARLTAFLGEHN